MSRWLISLAFALFVMGLGGTVAAVLAATEAPSASPARAALQTTAYPSPTLAVASPTAGSNQSTPATVAVTATSPATRTITPTSLPVTPTPISTPTLPVQFNPPTATPIRIPGLPVPGPGDRLPSTGGSLMSLFNLLLLTGGFGAVLFAAGRFLRRR